METGIPRLRCVVSSLAALALLIVWLQRIREERQLVRPQHVRDNQF